MSKKMTIDVNNFPNGFYDTNINIDIPVESIDITETQWLEFVENYGTRKWNTNTLSLDIFENAEILTNHKNYKKLEIDTTSEIQRQKYITTGSGQALTYQEKSEEASDFLVAGSPVDLTPYPFIQAEVNATGKTSEEAANDILTSQSNWISKGSSIEEYRIKAKIDITNASTLSDIDNITTLAIVNISNV